MNTNLFSPAPGRARPPGAPRLLTRSGSGAPGGRALPAVFRLCQNRTAAFTLIEVCIAVAVAGFALVAILAVLGDSMAHGRRASDETKATLIQQRLMRDLRSQPFGSSINIPSDASDKLTVSLTTSNARTWYFGREAQYLGTAVTADRYFQADLMAVPVTNLTGLTRIALSVSWISGQPRPTTNTLHTWVGQRE